MMSRPACERTHVRAFSDVNPHHDNLIHLNADNRVVRPGARAPIFETAT